MIPPKPKDAIWTDEQWKAIFLTGNNIIVSAGAGSGKTAVLTERIIQKLKQGISVTSLIVLTFTNAAAFEMKQRIRDKIKEEAKNNPALDKEIALVEQATITTFDSYSLSLVKKYHYLLGIPKDVSIIDSVLLEQKEKEYLKEIFLNSYQNEKFLKVLDTFTVKDDNKIFTSVLNIYHQLDVLNKKQEYLDQYLENFYKKEWIEKNIEIYQNFTFQNLDMIFELIDKMEEESDDVSEKFLAKVKEATEELRYMNCYEDIAKEVESVKLPTFSKKLEEYTTLKQYYEKIKYYMEEIKDLCNLASSKEQMQEEILSTYETVEVFIQLLKELDQKLMNYKLENNCYTFSDITRLSICLLEQNPNIREEIKQNTNEIMIDEYQDTNDIGDYFISLISKQNVYMVGDVKQSIYRFRNANPTIFMKKYENYKNHIEGEAIDLNCNFRSREEVIKDINRIFYPIMDKKIGGATYTDNHYLVYGNQAYSKLGYTEMNHSMEILDYHYNDTPYAKEYKKEEIEAFIIADDILSKMQNHYQIFNMKKQKLQDVTYSDFVILLDRKTNFDLYKKIFEYKGIPLCVHKDESFVYSSEIYVLKNILKLINDLKNKNLTNLNYSFYSVARSYLFSYDDDTIFEAITKQDIVSNPTFAPLFSKIQFLIPYSENASLSMLLQEIYEQFSFYEKSMEIGSVEEVNIKLEYLLSIVQSLEKSGITLAGFIDYLEQTFQNNSDISYSTNKPSHTNAVNIMTIHKSKGLEYSICYFAGLSKPFNRDDVKDNFLFNPSLGIIVPVFKEGIKDTIYKRLLKEKEISEDVSERIRLFYVALTRAKEKIIFVSNLDEIEYAFVDLQNGVVNDLERLSYKSFQDILLSIKNIVKPFIHPISYQVTKEYEWTKNQKQELEEKQNYPFEIIKCEINLEKQEEMHYSKKSTPSTSLQLLEIGKNLHRYLEYIDFHHFEEDLKKYNVPHLLQEKLRAMLKSPIFQDIEKSTFYQEYSFLYEEENKEKTGIIDLLIVKEEEWIIVDYKTSDINEKEYIKQVQGYMEYIKTITDKPVKGYLYSLLKEEYKEVELVYA